MVYILTWNVTRTCIQELLDNIKNNRGREETLIEETVAKIHDMYQAKSIVTVLFDIIAQLYNYDYVAMKSDIAKAVLFEACDFIPLDKIKVVALLLKCFEKADSLDLEYLSKECDRRILVEETYDNLPFD